MRVYRHAAEHQNPRLADPVDVRGEGEDYPLCEDPKRRESLRSAVGTVPGSTVDLATGPDADRQQADRVSLEETKRDDVGSAVSHCAWQRRTVRSIIASGAAEVVGTRRTTWSCSMSTAIGRSTCANDRPKQPRPARGVREGLSCMTGNCHVQF